MNNIFQRRGLRRRRIRTETFAVNQPSTTNRGWSGWPRIEENRVEWNNYVFSIQKFME